MVRPVFQAGLVLAALLPFLLSAEEAIPVPGLTEVVAETVEPASGQPWRYLRFLPERYYADEAALLPLLFYLHGSSGRGQDLALVRRYGPPSRLKDEQDFPMAMVAPQLPGGGWNPDALLTFLDEVMARYGFDPDRIYLTGVSLGGQGSWQLAARAPDRFAAFAPVCGYGDPRSATRITNLPVWGFHGARDDIIRMEPHRALFDVVHEAGGSARFTIYEEGDHGNIIVPVYRDARLYDWFLSHRRGVPGQPYPEAERIEVLPGPASRKAAALATPSPTPTPPSAEPIPPPMPQSSGPVPAKPGEFWDALFRLLDGESLPVPSPAPLPAVEP